MPAVDPTTLLSLLTFFPAIGALVLAFLPKDKPDALKLFTLVITAWCSRRRWDWYCPAPVVRPVEPRQR
jgi:hypothetical protein